MQYQASRLDCNLRECIGQVVLYYYSRNRQNLTGKLHLLANLGMVRCIMCTAAAATTTTFLNVGTIVAIVGVQFGQVNVIRSSKSAMMKSFKPC